ncbi:MAG: von Willebrand factor type A domain-containing protein [Opitutaceae bacterium]
MSDNDRPIDFGSSPRAELEMRVVAWVLGEATDTEIEALKLEIRNDPELEQFKKRIEEAHGLAGLAVGDADESLRLTPGRRKALLEQIDSPPEENETAGPLVYRRSLLGGWRKWVPAGAISVAASFILIFGFLRMSVHQPDTVFHDDIGMTGVSPEPPPVPESKSLFGDFQAEGRGVDDAKMVSPVSIRLSDLDKDQVAGRIQGGKYRQAGSDGAPQGQVVLAAPSSFHFSEPSPSISNEAAAQPRESRRDRQSQSASDESLTLSPFEVERDFEAGYVATDTIAGSRMKDRLEEAVPLDAPVGSGKKDGSLLSKEKQEGFRATIEQLKSVSEEFPEVQAVEDPVSTFSLHVSDVSFRLALAAIDRGEYPDPATIRPEEFYNAFDYGDPAPMAGEKVTGRVEQAAHPYLQQRNLVRIALKLASTGRGAGQPLHLTVLLDTSGSMQREDRRASVEASLQVLATLLGPDDLVSLIGFARQPHLLEEAVPGDEATRLVETASLTPSEGGTNLEEALRLARELAERHRDPSAQNRIVLITDGAANLGNADPEMLSGMIEDARQHGIAFDACGVGTDGLNDAVLEALTRKGDGRYYVIDRPEDAGEGFARQLAGAFRPAASNVKVQVRFNPSRVGGYRLIGFEKHRLNAEDFRNDAVDAAELAAEEGAVAVYQVEALPEGEGELGEVFVRFRDNESGRMVERSWTIPFDPQAPAFDLAPARIQLAGMAAILAEGLTGRSVGELIDMDEFLRISRELSRHFGPESRVGDLVRMIEELDRMQ